ncbi:MAG: cache domain-containing protein [Lachnospiraceae bacterium]|nr:cache domain-containing protein [Lachnospiraceae bacterium]
MKKQSGFLIKILTAVAVAIIALTVFVTTFTILRVHRSLLDSMYNQLNKAYNGTSYLFDIYKRNALGFAKDIAVNPDLVAAAKARDHEALFAITTPLVENAGLEYMVITDDEGFVIIRTHQPGVIPAPDDSIANQMNIQHALKGEPYVTVEQGKVVFLSVRAGAPIRDENGTIIGACSTGYVLSEDTIAYDIKNTFDIECTLYLEDAIVASTFDLEDGSSLSDYTDEAESLYTRVKAGETVNAITYIGEESYLTAIGPLYGAGDEVVGMIEVAMNERMLTSEINAMVMRLVFGAVAIAAVILLITLGVFHRLLAPVSEIGRRLIEVAGGDLSGEALTVKSNDEIGALSRAGNEMQEKLRSLVADVVMTASRVATASEELDASAQQMEQRTWDITAKIREISSEVDKITSEGGDYGKVSTSLNDTKETFLIMSETMTEISRAANELSVLAGELNDSTQSFKL